MRRFVTYGLFLLVVVLPTVAMIVYTTAYASHRYSSEIQFSIRGWDAPATDSIGGALGSTNASGASALVMANSYIVSEFLRSRDAILAIRSEIDPLKIYSSPDIDYFARYTGSASVDAFLPYWRAHLHSSFDPLTGIVTVMVEAMTPADTLKISQELKAASERLVNQLSSKVRDEAQSRANEDVERQVARLRDARAALQAFRNANHIIDPAKEIDGLMSSLKEMKSDRAKAQAEIDSQKVMMSSSAPSLVAARTRLQALDEQIRQAEERLASVNAQAGTLANVLSHYQELEIQQQIAEKAYTNALEAFERARRDAERKQIYLATFVEPSLPETPVFPSPVKNVSITLGVGLCLYMMMLVISHSLIDRIRAS